VVPVDASPKAWEAARYFLHLGWQIGLISNDGLEWDPYGDFFGYRYPFKNDDESLNNRFLYHKFKTVSQILN